MLQWHWGTCIFSDNIFLWIYEGSYGSSIFIFYGTFILVYIAAVPIYNLHSHQQCRELSFLPHPLWHLLFRGFLMIASLAGVKWYCIIVLMCIYLIISNAEHFSCTYWLSLCLLWRSVYFKSSAHFLSGFFFGVAKHIWRLISNQLHH